jgi:hypothetical protein
VGCVGLPSLFFLCCLAERQIRRAAPLRFDPRADAVTVAHIAAALEWATGTVKDWGYEEGKAMEQLVRAWTKYKRNDEDDPQSEEELNIALDALAVAHSARTFEFCSGKISVLRSNLTMRTSAWNPPLRRQSRIRYCCRS